MLERNLIPIRLVLTFVLAFMVAPLFAAPITGAITIATKNTDGSTIPTTGTGAITKWRIEYGTCGPLDNNNRPVFATKLGEVVGTPALTNYTTPDLAPATYCLRAYNTNSANIESDPANVLQATVPQPKPNPPAFTVTAPTAYEYKPSTNSMARVGIVPVGTPCGPELKTVSGVNYCRLEVIEADFVNWPSNVKLTEVWAVGG